MIFRKRSLPQIVFSLLILGILFSTMLLYLANTQKNRPKQTSSEQTTVSPTEPLPSTTIPPSLSQTPRSTDIPSPYPVHKKIVATMFWVGEKATEENEYIPNKASAWDAHWLEHFGGIDNPYERKGYYPKSFLPKENPFYFALPYDEFANYGRKQNAVNIPWFTPGISEEVSVLKNRWVRVTYKGNTCYGQWEDVGPFETDDIAYVFGDKQPKSKINKHAGIDLSPAFRTCLRMATNDYVDWQFVEDYAVPDGPWKKIITTSQANW